MNWSELLQGSGVQLRAGGAVFECGHTDDKTGVDGNNVEGWLLVLQKLPRRTLRKSLAAQQIAPNTVAAAADVQS
jgi:hypothetical protein